MTPNDIERTVGQYAHYPALIAVEQAAEIAQISTGTVYDWSSRGLLDGLKSRRGRHIRFDRDGFVSSLVDGDKN